MRSLYMSSTRKLFLLVLGLLYVSVLLANPDSVDKNEIYKLKGLEKELPIVKQISEVFEANKPLLIVGASGSGKTENLMTAVYVNHLSYEKLNVVPWTIDHLKEFPQEKLDKLNEYNLFDFSYSFLENYRNLSKNELKKVYFYDQTLEFKKIQNALLRYYYDDLKELLKNSQADVIILDEFTIGVDKKGLRDVEIDTAQLLLSLFSTIKDKQLAFIMHVPARANESLMQFVKKTYPDIVEVEMGYLPKDIEKEILAMVGIKGSVAEKLMSQFQGVPVPYIPVMRSEKTETEPDLSEQEQMGKAREIHDWAKNRVSYLKQYILGRSPNELQFALTAMAFDVPVVDDIPQKMKDWMRRTLMIYETKDGEIKMPPMIKDILKEHYINQLKANKDIELGLKPVQGQLEKLISQIEEYDSVKGIRETLVKKRGDDYHLTIVNPNVMYKARAATDTQWETFAKAFIKLQQQNRYEMTKLGKIENQAGDKTYFLIASDELIDQVIELRKSLGFQHQKTQKSNMAHQSHDEFYLPHVTLGFTKSDMYNKQNTTLIDIPIDIIFARQPEAIIEPPPPYQN